ncbi:hypothetical protein [Alienimonas chondri]|uniref:Uncharacterized protein n=1 Tax=Alienimonas chondri TaxID=2681879 RepID=A0ABX1VJL9_9PLAN|nr:hypothetical protein [Alienimonas chondri]NNJ27665.1 hypothetical protein [Alienimonas chondri]
MHQFVPMSTFEKVCAAFAILLGGGLMLLGAVGLFLGSSANFTLPPVLGVAPFFFGYGICIPLVRYWRMSNAPPSPPPNREDGARSDLV